MPSRILRLLSVIVKSGTPGGGEGGVDHLGGLGVGQHALGADRVEVALDELAEPALGRPLAAEDRADGIPLERHAQLVDVLGDEPGQGDRQVEPEGQLARRAPLVGHLEDLPQDLVRAGPLAGQDLHALDVRRLDRHEPEARRTSGGTPRASARGGSSPREAGPVFPQQAMPRPPGRQLIHSLPTQRASEDRRKHLQQDKKPWNHEGL